MKTIVIAILLIVVAPSTVRGQVGFAISWTEWPCVEAALPKGAVAISQVSEVFYSAYGAWYSFKAGIC